MLISARDLEFIELNRQIRASEDDVRIGGCYGQRFIGAGMRGKKIAITGTPGNALGAYLDGGIIDVNGNAQDAVGDTMNDGKIIVHGSAGDALGYAMRGGSIFIRDDAGYRAGIHMKEYKDKKPAIIIGGKAGSFLGEYLAGGIIVVLDIGESGIPVGNYAGTGMHGGKIFIRTNVQLMGFPEQVVSNVADEDDLREIEPYISEFAGYFNKDAERLLQDRYYVLKPNEKNPYHMLYTAN